MEISGLISKRTLQFSSFRLFVLGSCAGVIALTGGRSLVSPEQAQLACSLSIFMLSLAAGVFAYSLLHAFSSEQATLHPYLKLPKSLIRGGLNTNEEPLNFWMQDPFWKKKIILGTDHRQLRLSKSVMREDQWQQLIAALPADRQVQPPATKDSFRFVFLLYAALFAATHFLLKNPTDFIFFNLLAQGGYNSALALHGEFFRTLSYAWVHASDAHFWSNLIALLFIAQVLGKSFSNRTLASVIIASAVASGILGTLTKDYTVLVGASGAIMGAFGFLFAAQRNRDRRLNPLSRVARQKILYLLLFTEFCLSLKFAWYGGMVHLVGIATGYGMYWLHEKASHSAWHVRGEYVILAFGSLLFLSWANHTYQTLQQPKTLVNNAISTNDPFLAMLATTALPDLPNATHAEVLAARNQAQDSLDISSLFYWPLARTDYWLGNGSSALKSLRLFSATEPGSAEVRELWLAVERDVASQKNHGDPISTLPKGPAIAYLISTDFKQFARIRLPNRSSPITDALQSTAPIGWHLLAVTPLLSDAKKGTYGAWLIPKTKYRTSRTANLAEDSTH